MSETPVHPVGRRRRFAPLVVLAGLAGAIILSLSMINTLSAFVAAITNSNNTAAVGTMSLVETGPDGKTTCTGTSSTAATCATINKYGGNTAMVPGTTVATNTVTFVKPGTTAANTFTLTPAACKSTPTAVPPSVTCAPN